MTITKRIARLWDLAGVYRDRRIAAVVVFGIASGLPSPLLMANLSIRLADEGFSRTSIAAFGAMAAPYAVNFLWAPVFDRMRPPLLARLGQRRGWLVWTLVALISTLLLLGRQDPAAGLSAMAVFAVAAAFASASLDVVVDAYRIEILDPPQMAAGSAASILGWHLGGTVIGGAGGLLIAARLGWPVAYALLAGFLALPLAAVFLIREPKVDRPPKPATGRGMGAVLAEAVATPLGKLMQRPLWAELLAFIVLFKLGDAMLGRMSGIFYREIGFDYVTIAEVSKIYGIGAALAGGVLGGVALRAIGAGRGLFVAGVAMSLTNLLFAGLAADPSRAWFILAVTSDGLTTGFAVVAFVAFLSRLCDAGYAATQYALLASIGNLARIVVAGTAGWMVDCLHGDWQAFFVITALLAVPGLAILAHVLKKNQMGDGVFSRTNRKNS